MDHDRGDGATGGSAAALVAAVRNHFNATLGKDWDAVLLTAYNPKTGVKETVEVRREPERG